ncbi:diaminopimelate epimerase [Corallincola platygyrae]|uniref:Diaminopimelate epimerase n=1 Tax=Corallincola platygyrae TaxID=1193278 RepID=A0ABW4XJW7_9GAMM
MMQQLPFRKYQALGNDYILIDSQHTCSLSEETIRAICHRTYGVGADGILLSFTGLRTVSIYNSDGSEAEKSGNGLRIFAYHLIKTAAVEGDHFTICCKAGVHAVYWDGQKVTINMGSMRSVFDIDSGWQPAPISKSLKPQSFNIDGKQFEFVAIDIGNPHCVVLNASLDDLQHYGPLIENHSYFKDRINVQFLHQWDQKAIGIGIWERGSGHTLSSGSSSCAAFYVAHHLGFCSDQVEVNMEGGQLDLRLVEDDIWMSGDVKLIASGTIYTDELALEAINE